MARNRSRKTYERNPVENSRMEAAVQDVVNGQKKVASVAKEFDIKRTTLRRYIQKYKAAEWKKDVPFIPRYNSRQVFNVHQEQLLVDYFIAFVK